MTSTQVRFSTMCSQRVCASQAKWRSARGTIGRRLDVAAQERTLTTPHSTAAVGTRSWVQRSTGPCGALIFRKWLGLILVSPRGEGQGNRTHDRGDQGSIKSVGTALSMPPPLSWPTIILNIPPLFRPSLGPATACFSSSTHLPFSALLPPTSPSAFFPCFLCSFVFVVSHVWHSK